MEAPMIEKAKAVESIVIDALKARAGKRDEAIEHYKLENPLSSTMPYDKVYPSDELLVTAYLDDFIAPSALWHAIDDKISGKAVH